MASFRTYKKRDGSTSITAIVRKGGINLTETFTGTKSAAMAEAKAWAAITEQDIYHQRKKSPLAARQRLADVFDAYFDHLDLTKRKKAATIVYEQQSRKQIERLIGANTYLTDISTATITAFRDQRIREGIGASKIRSEIALISCLFKFAAQEKGLNVENPAGPGKMWRPKAPREKTDFLSAQDIKALMAACRMSRTKRLAAYVAVMLNTGLRPGEAATLRVSDIDQSKRSIWLDRTKNDDSRLIPLTESAWREVAPLLVNRHPEDYVFHRGRELPPAMKLKPASMFRGPFATAARAAGLTITPHGLRHTAATHMMEAGVHVRVIAAVLGHRTLQMAMRYTHPDEAVLRAAVDTLDGLVG